MPLHLFKMLTERRRRIEEGQHNAERIKKTCGAELRYQEVLRKANEDATVGRGARTGDAIGQKAAASDGDAEGIIAKAQDTIVQERNKTVAEVKRKWSILWSKPLPRLRQSDDAEDQKRLGRNRQTDRRLKHEDQQGIPSTGPRIVSTWPRRRPP
jgi:F0F1-type ATP synthase membrane subunit b/b'